MTGYCGTIIAYSMPPRKCRKDHSPRSGEDPTGSPLCIVYDVMLLELQTFITEDKRGTDPVVYERQQHGGKKLHRGMFSLCFSWTQGWTLSLKGSLSCWSTVVPTRCCRMTHALKSSVALSDQNDLIKMRLWKKQRIMKVPHEVGCRQPFVNFPVNWPSLKEF